MKSEINYNYCTSDFEREFYLQNWEEHATLKRLKLDWENLLYAIEIYAQENLIEKRATHFLKLFKPCREPD